MKNLLFMNLTTEMVWGLIIIALIMFLLILLVLCYKVFAPRDMFFTFGKENWAVHVMLGKKFTGKVILPSKTLYIDKKDQYRIKSFDSLPFRLVKKMKKEFTLRSFLGMYWIGIYPFYSLNERRQQWLEWKSTEGGGRNIILRDEPTKFLVCKPFEYAQFSEEAEDMNGVPLNIYYTVTLMPTSATLPIFGNDNAYGQVQTKCLSEVLLFTKKKTFANLGADNTTPVVTNDEFSLLLRSLNTKIPGAPIGDGIIKTLGYEIIDAKLDKVEITGPDKEELLKGSTQVYLINEKTKAQIVEAEGRLKTKKLDAEGNAALLKVKTEFLKEVSEIPGAMKVIEREATPGLTTLVEASSDMKTNLNIGGK